MSDPTKFERIADAEVEAIHKGLPKMDRFALRDALRAAYREIDRLEALLPTKTPMDALQEHYHNVNEGRFDE